MSTGEIVTCSRFAVQICLSTMKKICCFTYNILIQSCIIAHVTMLYRCIRTYSSMVIQDVWVIPDIVTSSFESVIGTLHIWQNLTGISGPYCTQYFIEKLAIFSRPIACRYFLTRGNCKPYDKRVSTYIGYHICYHMVWEFLIISLSVVN